MVFVCVLIDRVMLLDSDAADCLLCVLSKLVVGYELKNEMYIAQRNTRRCLRCKISTYKLIVQYYSGVSPEMWDDGIEIVIMTFSSTK